MTLAQLIPLVLQASLALSVFSLGLSASRGDGLYLFRHPKQLAKSLVSMNLIMLIFAIVVVALFDLHPAVKIALVALAALPGPARPRAPPFTRPPFNRFCRGLKC